ncbi:hypothetical protein EZV62_009315 [Acer yangbiense]|uniref:Uncharacterized protein n=1 Tax=Acer yangbiense TaxID=1000413 RepID=A0A5C7IFC5_9ROSI|nr:hypothetical protein EZV62_009315 [Acer yangbiense]
MITNFALYLILPSFILQAELKHCFVVCFKICSSMGLVYPRHHSWGITFEYNSFPYAFDSSQATKLKNRFSNLSNPPTNLESTSHESVTHNQAPSYPSLSTLNHIQSGSPLPASPTNTHSSNHGADEQVDPHVTLPTSALHQSHSLDSSTNQSEELDKSTWQLNTLLNYTMVLLLLPVMMTGTREELVTHFQDY